MPIPVVHGDGVGVVVITDVLAMVFMMTAFVLLACGASDNADNHRLVAVLRRLSVVSMQTIGAGDDDTAGSHATASNVLCWWLRCWC